MHPLLTLNFFDTSILPLHVFNVEEEVIVIRNGWTPKKNISTLALFAFFTANNERLLFSCDNIEIKASKRLDYGDYSNF